MVGMPSALPARARDEEQFRVTFGKTGVRVAGGLASMDPDALARYSVHGERGGLLEEHHVGKVFGVVGVKAFVVEDEDYEGVLGVRNACGTARLQSVTDRQFVDWWIDS